MQAVATEEVDVARAEIPDAGVDLDIVAATDRPGDHVALAADASFFGGDESLFDLPGDQGVVLGQLEGLAVPDPVDAAVADLGQDQRLAEAHHRADGGAHAGL